VAVGSKTLIDTTWRELVEVARWTPSPHNMQPWRVRIRSTGEIELLVDGQRLLPDTDPTGRFTEVAMGMFVESLAVAAAARRLALSPAYTHEPLRADNRLIPFATLTFAPKAVEEPLAADLVMRRRTSRVRYDGRPAPEEVMRELERVAAVAGHTFSWSSEPELVAWTVELNRDTLFYDMADPRTRAEVGRWLRFSAGEARRRRDGFSPKSLSLPGRLLWLFFHLHRLLDLPGFGGIVRKLYARTMEGTRTVGWLTGPFASSSDWIATGRMFARFWLTIERSGLHLHPFGSIVTNPTANARLQERLGRDLSQEELWLVMRIGFSGEPPRSLRLETDELVVA
jgi:hypothetical protein